MGCSSEEISEVSDSEIGDYEAKSYSELENGRHAVRNPNGTYRCPLCVRKKNKQAYIHQQILQHASGIGASNRRAKEKANHRALARYLTTSNQNPEDNQMLPLKLQEEDDQFVWPWKGILVNVPTEVEEGRWLKAELSDLNPLKIRALWKRAESISRSDPGEGATGATAMASAERGSTDGSRGLRTIIWLAPLEGT